MISVEKALTERLPFFAQYPESKTAKSVTSVLKRLTNEAMINQVLDDLAGLEGLDFVEAALDRFDFHYQVDAREISHIPSDGPLVVVANHPLGVFDGLALIHLISKVRPDLKVVVNDILGQFDALSSLLLPIRNMGSSARRSDILAINAHVRTGKAVLVFPSGEVSRLRPTGVKDPKWSTGFLRFAKRADAPILPIFVKAKNSPTFYTLSMLNKPASAFLLPREMLRQQGRRIALEIGKPLAPEFLNQPQDLKKQAKAVRRYLYGLKEKRHARGLPVLTPVAHPERRNQLRQELRASTLLGATADGKQIYLVKANGCPHVIRELGRLRELTFRMVGEGTNGCRDVDQYDRYYDHIVLWDDDALDIAGAYRVALTAAIAQSRGLAGLYTNSLFKIPESSPFVLDGMELGRSFVQPRYWGSRSLEYLWHGIGAYLRNFQEAEKPRYLFGAVSVSNALPTLAKDILIAHYQYRYPGQHWGVAARCCYQFDPDSQAAIAELAAQTDAASAFRILKRSMRKQGCAVPTLFKQYSDLCAGAGVSYAAFSKDQGFNSVDGLVVVDLTMLKPEKFKRYIAPAEAEKEEAIGAVPYANADSV